MVQLNVVGDVELQIVLWGFLLADVEDGEVRQIGHLADCRAPLGDGVTVGDDDYVAPLQRLQHSSQSVRHFVTLQVISYIVILLLGAGKGDKVNK